ncbi:MAG: HIT domain-containing protein [Chloroflexota bacterium]
MDRLWTPWRMSYVGSASPAPGCFLCLARDASAAEDDDRHIVLRGQRVIALLNRFPYSTGHVMIAPHDHTADYPGLSTEIVAELFATCQRIVEALSAEYRPDGFNVGMNLGHAAGAGVPDHLHLHVVPRWVGDANFMATTADTKVMPESLEQTYGRLRRRLGQAPAGAD